MLTIIAVNSTLSEQCPEIGKNVKKSVIFCQALSLLVVSSPRSPARSQTLVLIYIYNTELSIIFSTDLYIQH